MFPPLSQPADELMRLLVKTFWLGKVLKLVG
jgi:hypothetical protein